MNPPGGEASLSARAAEVSMSTAFVQGGTGTVSINSILTRKGRSFWSKEDQEMEAEKWESNHPGQTVLRPWESDAEQKKRIDARSGALPKQPQLMMDPDRAQHELKSLKAQLATLGTDHPEYRRLFTTMVHEIHLLEGVCKVPLTKYNIGAVITKEDEKVPEELLQRYRKHVQLKAGPRRLEIEKCEEVDVPFLRLIQNRDSDGEMQAAALARLMQLGMV
jgi:hypothetical protein